MLEQLPAALTLHFLNVLLHENREEIEVNSLEGLGFVLLFICNELFQSCQVNFLHLVVVNVLLEVDNVIVVHQAIAILIADAEDSSKRPFEVGFDFLLDRIVERGDGVKHSELSCDDDVDQIQEHLGRALDACLDLVRLQEVLIKQIRQIIRWLARPQIDFVTHENYGNLVVYLTDPGHPMCL